MQTNSNKGSKEIFYPELSYILTGILFAVHNELGQYAREKQYGDLFEIKLKENNIPHHRELAIANSGNILDFVIEDKIVVELKSTRSLTPEHYRQIQNYLQQTEMKLGLIVNFRPKFLKPIRIVRIETKKETS